MLVSLETRITAPSNRSNVVGEVSEPAPTSESHVASQPGGNQAERNTCAARGAHPY